MFTANQLSRAIAACFALLLVLTTSQIGAAQVRSRVLNGANSTDSTPWMVSIGYAGMPVPDAHICGGVLLNPTTVVTAAHCVQPSLATPSDLVVSFGRNRLTDPAGGEATIRGIVVHPEFDDFKLTNDIALVYLNEPIAAGSFVGLSSSAFDEATVGTTAVLYGWGQTDGDIPVRPDALQRAELPIVANPECSERLGLDFVPSGMLCAGKLATSEQQGDGVDACSGDSGGPLISYAGGSPILVGAVSWGFVCGSTKVYGVYTRISAYAEWILSAPQVAPFPLGDIVMNGLPQVGDTVTCRPPELGGDAPLTPSVEWLDVDSGEKLSADIKLKLTGKDVGRAITCITRAHNQGGSLELASERVLTILPRARAITALQGNRRQVAASRGSCRGKKCEYALAFKRDLKAVRFLIEGSDGTSRVLKHESLSGNTASVSVARNREGTIFVRAVLDNGKSILVRFEL